MTTDKNKYLNKACPDQTAHHVTATVARNDKTNIEQQRLTRTVYASAHTHQSLNVSHTQTKEVKEGTILAPLDSYACTLTLKTPRKNASENVVCRSRLLQMIA